MIESKNKISQTKEKVCKSNVDLDYNTNMHIVGKCNILAVSAMQYVRKCVKLYSELYFSPDWCHCDEWLWHVHGDKWNWKHKHTYLVIKMELKT